MGTSDPRSGGVRAAVVQAAPAPFDTPRSLQKVADLTADAARRDARLVVFPEAFVGGYPKGHDFGVSVGVRTPEGRDEFRRLFESAVEVPGPGAEALGKAARDNAVHLVVGVIERDGGTLYCAALLYGPDGTLLGRHRKLMPTAMERVIWGSGDGSTLPVVATDVGRIGAVICWENYMPLLRTAMFARGIELYCAVTVDDRETWIPTVRHIALEGRCFVLSACQFLRRADDVLIRGGSCIVGPLGELLTGPVYGEECVLVADLDRADLARAKFDFDVVGHYARPDVFQLHVNERPMRPVTFGGASVLVDPAVGDLVRLRDVESGDLPLMFQMQLDPESNRLAVTNPRNAEAFDALWAEALRDPGCTAKAVLLGGMFAGYVCCFRQDGRANVGYWIGREHWGKGVATRALGQLLLEVTTRPLYAHVATSNGASLRVLRKCGFVVERVQVSPATDRYPECEEAVLVLRG